MPRAPPPAHAPSPETGERQPAARCPSRCAAGWRSSNAAAARCACGCACRCWSTAGGARWRLRPPRGWAMAAERGQASLELLGALPVVLLLGAVLLQLLAVGYSATLAGSAAEAGALAVASGGDAVAAARASVPGWSRAGMRVNAAGGRVSVRMRPPSPLAAVRGALELQASAKVQAP